jgi:hypothetical protein
MAPRARRAARAQRERPELPTGRAARRPPAHAGALRRRQTAVTEHGSGYVKLAYDEVDADLEPGTDAAALADCTGSVTSLHAVCEEVEADVPEEFLLGAS